MDEDEGQATFRIFRAADAPSLAEAGCMSLEPFTEVQLAGMEKLRDAGVLEASELKVLVNIPGFSLPHAWFKPGHPLPLHSHDADCLYYIIAGSVRLGTEDLGARDSFFIPANVPYTYKTGPEGVELLEIRQANSFNFVNLAKGEAYWARALEQTLAHRESWKTARPPRLNA
ncbi:MAG TPA: cupin domain-containing protein [Novosphingobium sp.]|nr:cupin domain-containing protein [Novosphingobium sp.]